MRIEILKIRKTVYDAIDSFLKTQGFVEVASPILTPFLCEVACVGGSDKISVNYYGETLYLSQSSQLYLEDLCFQLKNVYCINPAFRAESTMLASHLSEFWMCEAEMRDIVFEDVIQNVKGLVRNIISRVLDNNVQDLYSMNAPVNIFDKLMRKPMMQITYTDAISILREEKMKISWGEDISEGHEQILTRYFDNMLVIVTAYPKVLSSFYKKENPDNPETTLSFDLIAPYGFREIASGSMRETRVDKLQKALMLATEEIKPYEWYLNIIAQNPNEHGGYGLGIERLLTWLCNLRDIREAIPYPRTENLIWP